MKKLVARACLALALAGTIPVANAAPILLVRGTVSAPNTAERNYAARLTTLFGRRLTDIGIPFDMVDDENIATGLASARLAILCYNPNPPAGQLAALRQFVERGGKLMVFYSSSRPLAALLNMRLGEYMSAPLGGRWSRIVFDPAAPPHVPATVRQESRNIRPVYPAAPDAKIVAHWANGADQVAPEPAWVQSSRGLWMSHVLLNDGDTRRKNQMLLALIADCVPALWQQAAEKSVTNVCRFDGVSGFQTVVDSIRASLSQDKDKDPPNIRDLVERAETLHENLPQLTAKGQYMEAVSAARRIDDLVLEAYARLQSTRPGELRGIWEHTGMGLYPGDWDKTGRILAANGITDLFANMAWAGAAHYPSRVVPPSDILVLRGNQLAACIAAARKAGVRIHVWKVCWNLSKAPAALVDRLRKAGRLQVSDTGARLDWLCPSNTENLKMEKDMIRELVSDYDIDGIHLDYIRYPDSHACYCPVCRHNFEQSLDRPLAAWPADVQKEPLLAAYRTWRANQITRLVRDVRAIMNAAKPGIKLSAAVYGRYPLCVASVGQDWGAWLQEGLVDFICPMDYTEELAKFEALVDMQTRLPSAAGRIYPGIGVTAAESTLNAFQVIRQINLLREKGAAGYVLFDLNHNTEDDILPYLSVGIAGER